MRIPLFAKLALPVIGVATVAVLASGWKEMERSKRIEAEVDSLRQEAERIRTENGTLEEKIAFFSTESSEEREAKERLGMKKNDEEAVILDVRSTTSETEPAAEETDDSDRMPGDIPNHMKWASHFGIVR